MDEWFHIGMTTDGSRVSLYLDGNYNCCVFGQASGANCNNSIMIGDGFAGDIRHVRIFSECLDADTMKKSCMSRIWTSFLWRGMILHKIRLRSRLATT